MGAHTKTNRNIYKHNAFLQCFVAAHVRAHNLLPRWATPSDYEPLREDAAKLRTLGNEIPCEDRILIARPFVVAYYWFSNVTNEKHDLLRKVLRELFPEDAYACWRDSKLGKA